MNKLNDQSKLDRPKRRNTIHLGHISKRSIIKKNEKSFEDLNETKYVIFSKHNDFTTLKN